MEGLEFVDMREDLIVDGDLDGGGFKEFDEKNRNRIENFKDMVFYWFGFMGVVYVLMKVVEILGFVLVFLVRNIVIFGLGGVGEGMGSNKGVFRDCVLVKKGLMVGDVVRKVMGDVLIVYIEGVGGLRVVED